MSDHPTPTAKQLRYIQALAMKRGISFTPPKTRSQASSLIDQLKRTRPNSITERSIELRAVRDAVHTQAGDAARVRDDEITGHGSHCTWKRDAS